MEEKTAAEETTRSGVKISGSHAEETDEVVSAGQCYPIYSYSANPWNPTWVCPACDAENSEQVKVCGVCGAARPAAGVPKDEFPYPGGTGGTGGAGGHKETEPPSGGEGPGKPDEPKKPKKKRGGILVVLAVALAALAAEGYSGAAFTLKDNNGLVLYQSALPDVTQNAAQTADRYDLAAVTAKIKAAGMTPVNARTGEPERLGKLLCCRGKKQDEVDAICAGDIGAVTKLSNAVTGDTLCDAKRVISFKPTEFQAPCLSMAIVLKGKGDEAKIAGAMQRLIEEDPCIGFENNVETKQQVISGLGEQHLDVVVSKLKSKFGIDVGLVKPRVAYRETIRKKVRVQGKHKKQSGGHGQYGDVWIEFEPCDSDSLVFEEKVVGGSVPKNFFPAVEKGLQDCVSRGMIAGYPVVGLKAILVDGSYHPVDSNEMAFKTAASLAYKAGLPQANPVILEPIGTLKVQVPAANMGDINSELSKRRGRMLGMNPAEDGLQEIEAEVPMSEMFDFPTALRSITQGRGSFTLTFAHYEQLPKEKEAEVIAEAKSMMEEE